MPESATTNGDHDLDAVTAGQKNLAVPPTRNELAVALTRNTLTGIAKHIDERRDSQRITQCRKLAGVAIDEQFH